MPASRLSPNRRSASARSAARRSLDRRSEPCRGRRAGHAVQTGFEHGRARCQARHAERGIKVARSIAWLSSRRASGSSRPPPASAAPARTGRRPDRSGGCSRGSLTALSEGQVRERAAEHEVDLAAGEGSDGLSAAAPPSSTSSLLASSSSPATISAREAKLTRPCLYRADAERPGAEAAADDRDFRLGEQREQVRARREQPDFDHPVGHRDDVVDRAERVLERVLAARARSCASRSCATCSAVILRPSGHSADASGRCS